MRSVTYTCDRCGQEIKTLYAMPRYKVSVYNESYDNFYQNLDLCMDCGKRLEEFIACKNIQEGK